jgi:hypothetical protein
LSTQTQKKTNRQILEEIAALIATEQVGYGLRLGLADLLALLTPSISDDLIRWLAALVENGNQIGDLGVPDGPCQQIERSHAPAWLALYVVAAHDRLAQATDVAAAQQAEERYYALHLQAEERRQRAAALQDMTARLLGDRTETTLAYLGWHAVLDEHTTPECRAADGSNFRADQMPLIGWPGAVHAACRCTCGPPIPGAPLLPSI